MGVMGLGESDPGPVLRDLREGMEEITEGFYSFSNLSGGIYENTAHARIGDTSRPDQIVKRIVITAGCLHRPPSPAHEDPMFPGK